VSTLERVWIAYLVAVLAVAGLFPGAGPSYHGGWFLAVHGGLLVLQLGIAVAARTASAARLRLVRSAAVLVTLPIVFSSLGWLLPAVNPEPWEWRWLAVDRAVFGFDPTVALQKVLFPAFTDVLQLSYVSFYVLPVAACLVVLRVGGAAAFDRALTIVVFSFLFSYLGYLLFPTLPPTRSLYHEPLCGLWCTTSLHRFVDSVEMHHWDCFPSGHTMLAVICVLLVRRWARPWFWPFAVVASLLVFSTLALHYHWVSDVVAGALLVWPALRLGDLLLDRDGAPPAVGRAATLPQPV
jgi:membrane-associated phospholipid phosphatase